MASLLLPHFFEILLRIFNNKFPQRLDLNHLPQPRLTCENISGNKWGLSPHSYTILPNLINIYFLLYFSLCGIYVPGCLHL